MNHQAGVDPNDEEERLKLPEIITPTAGMGIGKAKQHVKQNTPEEEPQKSTAEEPPLDDIAEVLANFRASPVAKSISASVSTPPSTTLKARTSPT